MITHGTVETSAIMGKQPKNQPNAGAPKRTVAVNRKARHEYEILDTLVAGIVLTGTEIKSIRAGKVSLAQSFAHIDNEEVFLHGCSIAQYDHGNIHNHEPDRVRKLLLTRDEIKKLIGKTKEKGLTLIPLKMFFKRSWIKVEIGVCRGKQLHDKRRDIAKRDTQRDMERALKDRY